MSLYDKIMSIYPTLKLEDFSPMNKIIFLCDNSDGKGEFIKEWNHPTLAKPTDEQLA